MSATECIVKAGSGIQWHRTEDGSITIKTRDCFILLRPADANKENRNASLDQSLWTFSKSSVVEKAEEICFIWSDRVGGCKEGVIERPHTECDTPAAAAGSEWTEDGEAEDGEAEDDDFEDGEDEDGETEDNEVGYRDVEQTKKSKRKPDPFHELCVKGAKHWEKTTPPNEETISNWITNPITLFGYGDAVTSEQWSFNSVHDSKDYLEKLKDCLHNANLAAKLQMRMEEAQHQEEAQRKRKKRTTASKAKNHEPACRKAMLRDIVPGFDNLSEQEKDTKQTKYNRCIIRGRTTLFLASRKPGLVATVAPYLSIRKYVSRRNQGAAGQVLISLVVCFYGLREKIQSFLN
jgi:hypothetical protein